MKFNANNPEQPDFLTELYNCGDITIGPDGTPQMNPGLAAEIANIFLEGYKKNMPTGYLPDSDRPIRRELFTNSEPQDP